MSPGSCLLKDRIWIVEKRTLFNDISLSNLILMNQYYENREYIKRIQDCVTLNYSSVYLTSYRVNCSYDYKLLSKKAKFCNL